MLNKAKEQSEASVLPRGEAGSRYAFGTPILVLDLDILERNIGVMAETMKRFGRALRPHAKSHKCSKIAMMQLQAGAIGICCATLDEAQIMQRAGVTSLLITSPVTTDFQIARLIDLTRRAADTMIVVDASENIEAIANAARAAGVSVNILIDIELGFGRTGVAGPAEALMLARLARRLDGVLFCGVQAYGGQLQHTADYEERARVTAEAGLFISSILNHLSQNGFETPIVSGGGTGTHAFDGSSGPFTEIQAGSYPLMDADYERIEYRPGQQWPFDVSLFVQTSVISRNVLGTVTVDAGTKALALNGARPRLTTPSLASSAYEFSGDEHGRIKLAKGVEQPRLGARLELVTSHCDPTVAQYGFYHCVRGDVLVDIWPIDARGRTTE
ncbi:DSD1 family PLP-dependent enzyme [Mesorhizobium sp. M7A.F.Ca.US.006.01.1.1]|uniref:DSD1 family PLP-dependent enzyme n=1 Tax=Mesorhizobium sp. M7A.F.Ca.US.006.01.1.1 TaxID=2496707 RepID=UPI000FCC0658|nr:DSD1 family PLP-dependent enzyme [Mesorhizobium sp. M7A.F.Ca.US.006.01.1.1]RUZ72654.1 DSD1 family PLP-dependent enzyme [Mesorhizobium sp. M7A.F.Ca.US.006.01.1.1]